MNHRAFTISAIVLVAVVMGMGAVAPMIPQAEAHIQGKIRGHDSTPDARHDGGASSHDACTIGGKSGFLHYVDATGNGSHDPNEPTICLPVRLQ